MKPATRAGLWGLVDRAAMVRLAFGGAFLTLAINAVGLVSPLFFTQVYDRVLSTGSVPTLAALVAAALVAIGIGAAFEQWRAVVFTRMAAGVYVDLEPRVFHASHAAAIAGVQGRRSRPLDDLENVRATMSGPLPGALLDLIFAPFLLAMLYLMNEWLGHFALAVLLLMSLMATVTQWMISGSMRKSAEASQAASSLAESHLRSAEAAAAMGYQEQAFDRWALTNREAVSSQIRSAAHASGLMALGRGVRSGSSILIIAVAAWLTLSNQISSGSIIAASIILGRLIAPVDALLGGWRQLVQGRLAAERLESLLARPEPAEAPMALKPAGRLSVDGLTAVSSSDFPILRGITFALEPGEAVAVLGPSGSGKSTLLRCLMGVWPKMAGSIRLDGAPLAEMDRRSIGPLMGFLPQTSDLSPGTIAENIARFGPADHDAVQKAARAAGAEGMIASLPRGYETEVGEAGLQLSAGQRRRIALARALFGAPALVCLDEPEANLDRDGEIALAQALQVLKASGATVLIAAHRPSVVSHVDKVMVIKDGRVAEFGPAAEVLPGLSGGNVRRMGQ